MPDQVDHTQRPRRGRHPGGRGRGQPRPTTDDRGGHIERAGIDAPSNVQYSQRDTPTPDVQSSPRQQRRSPRPEQSTGESGPSRPSRRERFRATLTDSPALQTHHEPSRKPKPPRRPREPPGDDLTSTLTHALRTPPFADCSICFNPIRPEQATWSCSPPLSIDDKDVEGSQCCWNTFHLKCIRAWAEKSVKEFEEAWRARGELRPGEWRCPGCRATRQAVPHTYMCFCLRMRNPAPPRISTPHSCAQPCSRHRLGCKHACPLPCHPGPCPPCAVTIQAACFCGKERHRARCQVGGTAMSFSCSQPCLKPLRCGNSDHLCAEMCHEGPCLPCSQREEVRCWCGRQLKSVACGEVKSEDSIKCVIVKDDGSEQVWMGSYGCDHPCERPFACSHHTCSKLCHPPSGTPPPCPFDPVCVVSCACGRCRVARSANELPTSSKRSSTALLPPRTSCTSPLPTCTSPCSKFLPCGHICKTTCHWDPCPPCNEQVERTCRCGATKHKTPCGDAVLAECPSGDDTPASETILCDKPCQALRTCGRHQCGRICCPLAFLAKSTKKRDPQHVDTDVHAQLLHDLHACDLPCGRVLQCGNHHCERCDHKGSCGVCPRGVFEELVCPCGRTVLEPPISCGTRLRCVYPCARPAPACGHLHVPHACHEEVVIAGADTAEEGLGLALLGEGEGADMGSGPCPPCPYLTEKVCACGKKRVGNVRCSQERVSCGSVCGKLLGCGFHHCERLCHADACGTCAAVCGKPRKSCFPEQHPCTQTCHAPASCPETEPCLAPVTLTCPCGHLRSTVPCSGTKLVLACTGECEIKKRNARLADALGISEEKREARGLKVTYTPELVSVARVLGHKFVSLVEKAFSDFITSSRPSQVLPHMPPDRRKFVHDLAAVYRMDTIMVDQEPHRSVQLIRRIDTRAPAPSLSQYIASGLSTGRLVDVRLGSGRGGGVGAAASADTGTGSGSGGSVWGGVGGNVGVGAQMGTSASAGTGRWSAVAKSGLGTPRSGTPVQVPSPVVRSREVSPGPSTSTGKLGLGLGGTKAGVWVSPTVQAQRGRENTTTASVPAVVVEPEGQGSPSTDVGQQDEDVPDHWEDDDV